MTVMDDDFEFPVLTVDGVVFQLINNQLAVLLIERAFEPFLGVHALPGLYIAKDQTSRQALEQVLVQKTGVSTEQLELIEQPHAFDAPKRDPRGYAVTIMYIGLARDVTPGKHAGMSNGQKPQFVPLAKLPKLAYDHAAIVAFARDRLKSLAMSTSVVAGLLPRTFTLHQLQAAYEAIFDQTLDKRNFRKKMQARGLIEPTGKTAMDGAHRPAQLYRFGQASPLF